MSEQAEKPAVPPVSRITPLGTENAPFIYFDGSTAFGTNFGAVQIELAANVLTPDGKGGVKTEVVMTAHLRCSPNAAADLRQAIDKMLLLGAKTEGQAN
jgi:hypothetical protein